MTEAEKLRQERDQWKDEALCLREENLALRARVKEAEEWKLRVILVKKALGVDE